MKWKKEIVAVAVLGTACLILAFQNCGSNFGGKTLGTVKLSSSGLLTLSVDVLNGAGVIIRDGEATCKPGSTPEQAETITFQLSASDDVTFLCLRIEPLGGLTVAEMTPWNCTEARPLLGGQPAGRFDYAAGFGHRKAILQYRSVAPNVLNYKVRFQGQNSRGVKSHVVDRSFRVLNCSGGTTSTTTTSSTTTSTFLASTTTTRVGGTTTTTRVGGTTTTTRVGGTTTTTQGGGGVTTTTQGNGGTTTTTQGGGGATTTTMTGGGSTTTFSGGTSTTVTTTSLTTTTTANDPTGQCSLEDFSPCGAGHSCSTCSIGPTSYHLQCLKESLGVGICNLCGDDYAGVCGQGCQSIDPSDIGTYDPQCCPMGAYTTNDCSIFGASKCDPDNEHCEAVATGCYRCVPN